MYLGTPFGVARGVLESTQDLVGTETLVEPSIRRCAPATQQSIDQHAPNQLPSKQPTHFWTSPHLNVISDQDGQDGQDGQDDSP